MLKFKAGDKVRIIESKDSWAHNHKTGSIGTVVGFFITGSPLVIVGNDKQAVQSSCLKLVTNPYPKIHHKGSLKIVFNPPYTVVIDKINDRTAKAKCKATDEFDETKGLAIALLRLIDPDEDVSWICGK